MKGALLIGIDNYPGSARLLGCVNDATRMAALLETNGDGSPNFQVELKNDIQTKTGIKKLVGKLLASDLHTALFYFSGHGCMTDRGGYIVTPDFSEFDEGILMDELLGMCNKSPIREKLIILDCCYSGAFGNMKIGNGEGAYLGEGITVFTASAKAEKAVETGRHGLFTSLLINALEGGAADVAGHITAGSIYAYVDRSLGFWQQRPQFKTNVSRFLPLRTVQPAIPAQEVLKKIVDYFKQPDEIFPLDPSFEFTNTDIAINEHVAVFEVLQQMRGVGLVEPDGEKHMYWAAQHSKGCKLTMLGKQYWTWVRDKRI